MARILLNNSPFISIAILAPIKAPINPEKPKYILNGKFETPLLLNPAVADNVDIKIATLFVPLATAAGNPKKINKGNVNKEPPPAIVFIKPATNPARINKGYSHINSSIINISQM